MNTASNRNPGKCSYPLPPKKTFSACHAPECTDRAQTSTTVSGRSSRVALVSVLSRSAPSKRYVRKHVPYHTIPYHTIPYHTIPYRTYHTIPYEAKPCISYPRHPMPCHSHLPVPYHKVIVPSHIVACTVVSLCYLRLRQLMKEDTCVLCKTVMDRVMVCNAENLRYVHWPLPSKRGICTVSPLTSCPLLIIGGK